MRGSQASIFSRVLSVYDLSMIYAEFPRLLQVVVLSTFTNRNYQIQVNDE